VRDWRPPCRLLQRHHLVDRHGVTRYPGTRAAHRPVWLRFPRRLIAERRIRFVRMGRDVWIPDSAIADYVAAQAVEAIRLPRMR